MHVFHPKSCFLKKELRIKKKRMENSFLCWLELSSPPSFSFFSAGCDWLAVFILRFIQLFVSLSCLQLFAFLCIFRYLLFVGCCSHEMRETNEKIRIRAMNEHWWWCDGGCCLFHFVTFFSFLGYFIKFHSTREREREKDKCIIIPHVYCHAYFVRVYACEHKKRAMRVCVKIHNTFVRPFECRAPGFNMKECQKVKAPSTYTMYNWLWKTRTSKLYYELIFPI